MVVSCDICGKQFDSFRGLNGHMNAHLIKRAEDGWAYWTEPSPHGSIRPKKTTTRKPTVKAKKPAAKKKTGRKAPTLSATKRKIGTRMRGNDGKMWQVKKSGKSQRWMAGAETFEAGDYNSFTDEFEALIKKYGQLLEYDTTFHSKERGGDDIMHIHTSFRPNNTDFDNVNFDAERDCNYSCPDCGTSMYQTYSDNFGQYCACTGCGSEYITKPMNAENWGGDPKGQLAKALQKAREKVKPKPLNITKLPHPDQKYISDFEADEWKLLPRDPLGRWQKPVRSESINQLRESLQTSVPAISELLNLYGGDNPDNRYKLYNDLQSLKIDAMDAALPDDSTVSFDNRDMSWMTPQEYYEYILEEPIDVPDDTEDDSTTFEFQERLVRYTAMVMLPKEVETLIKENRDQITDDLFADNEEAESEINFLNAVRRYQKLSEQWSAEE